MKRLLNIRLIAVLLLSLICGSISANKSNADKKLLLIINSYTESAPWSRAMVAPISYYVANSNKVRAELFSLNNTMVTDSAKYQVVKDNLFDTYTDQRPDYLVIIGSLAFTLCDEIKARWGDVPILLITRDFTNWPLYYYFSGYHNELPDQQYPSISALRPDFNFTAIQVPDLYKQTIDLMRQLRPGIKRIVLFSDPVWLNRMLANDIRIYLYQEHPDLDFNWVQASAERLDDLQEYLVNPKPEDGLLLSTWNYEKPGPFGYPILSFGDINLLSSSVNPVFSLCESYMNMGAIGGVYPDNQRISNQIEDALDQMINQGKDMRDIKFATNLHHTYTMLNYPMLKEYNISDSRCPDNTVFVNKPAGFWTKYGWQMLLAIAIVVLVIIVFLYYTASQRHKIEALSRQKRLVDHMPVPYSKARVIYDHNHQVINIKYTIYNEAFGHLLLTNCWSEAPLMIFPLDFIAQKTAQLLDGQETVSFLYHFDKTDTYWIFSLCIVTDKDVDSNGLVQDIDIFAIDVTSRQKNEMELKQLTSKLDMTMNVAKLIPWEWDLQRDVINFDAYSIYEVANHDTPSKRTGMQMRIKEYLTLINPDDRAAFLDAKEKLLTGSAVEMHCTYRVKVTHQGQDTEEWVEIQGNITGTDAEGKPTVISGAHRIVTASKLQELDLIAAKEKASEADKMKSAFLANMSHEIRTPLNAIVGFSGLICETDDPKKRQEFAAIINQNNDMLLSLINDILDLAKIESNTLDISVSAVNINAVLKAVAETVRGRLQKDVVLNIVPGATECMVMTDGNRLAQVLVNLLVNATKFTTKGSITFGYDIASDAEMYFYVKDTGIGVSLDNQARLFQRFGKLDNFSQGNGLGLAICKSVVELLGGTIGMQSRGEGKGSTFWFTIPYRPAATEAETPMAETAQSKESMVLETEISHRSQPSVHPNDETATETVTAPINDTPQPEATPAVKGNDKAPLILVAEDMEGNFLLIKHLIPSNYRILHAWNGREAVEMFMEHHPDVVLMDINMPEMNGYEATETIRKISKNVPVIAVTAYAYASDRKRILRSGFNDYISKPVTRDALLEALNRHLS